MAEDIAVLVIRHPDHPTEIYCTHDAQEIVFDLGAQYDISRNVFDTWERDQIKDDLQRALDARIEYQDTPLQTGLDELIDILTKALDQE